jgi:hypothetical protein
VQPPSARTSIQGDIRMKHIVCYSGGHSSGLVAVEVVRKYGKNNVILLNHDISASVENVDIKRFKQELADYLELPITYANIRDLPTDKIPDQFDVVVGASAFKVGTGTELCTSRLKTEPFAKWLAVNVKDKNDYIIHYGFDVTERARIQRRSSIMGQQGFITDYPLALWKDRTIFSTLEINISPPNTYDMFKHANCVGCLKAGKQHWYVVYCTRKDIWEKAKWAEDEIGYTIIKGTTLKELEPLFETMFEAGIAPTEHTQPQTFWAGAKKIIRINVEVDSGSKPCECVF